MENARRIWEEGFTKNITTMRDSVAPEIELTFEEFYKKFKEIEGDRLPTKEEINEMTLLFSHFKKLLDTAQYLAGSATIFLQALEASIKKEEK